MYNGKGDNRRLENVLTYLFVINVYILSNGRKSHYG